MKNMRSEEAICRSLTITLDNWAMGLPHPYAKRINQIPKIGVRIQNIIILSQIRLLINTTESCLFGLTRTEGNWGNMMQG